MALAPRCLIFVGVTKNISGVMQLDLYVALEKPEFDPQSLLGFNPYKDSPNNPNGLTTTVGNIFYFSNNDYQDYKERTLQLSQLKEFVAKRNDALPDKTIGLVFCASHKIADLVIKKVNAKGYLSWIPAPSGDAIIPYFGQSLAPWHTAAILEKESEPQKQLLFSKLPILLTTIYALTNWGNSMT